MSIVETFNNFVAKLNSIQEALFSADINLKTLNHEFLTSDSVIISRC